jgi:mono/diheme cytochrome c family protein
MRIGSVFVASVLISVMLGACSGDDNDSTPAGTGGAAGGGGTAGSGGVSGDGGGVDLVARGDYLVNHVAACVDCHTPRNPDGTPDMTKFMAGSPNFADLAPTDDTKGAIHAKNLTPDNATGLGTWTDAEIKKAFLDGIDKDGNVLVPVMPYFVFHNMSAEDADAIVAYLRSIPAIDNAIPEDQPLLFPFSDPIPPVPANVIPDTTLAPTDPNYESAMRGKYLAGNIGTCMECHTERTFGAAVPLDQNKLFAGGVHFDAASLGLPVPPFPAEIVTRNITPHANGIQGWTAQAVAAALKKGVDIDNTPLCPPMPAGAMQAFGGLTDQDALDIGNYVTTIPPIDNGVLPNCVPPSPPSDGGTSDAGTDAGDASTD